MRKTFKIPLYCQKVLVIVSKDPPNVAAGRHRVTVPFERKHARLKVEAATWVLPDLKIVVCVKPRASIDTISHEAMHVAFFTAERIGIEWDISGANEPLAYITGHVASKLWDLTRTPPKPL